MSDVKTDETAASMSSPRLAQFQQEVGKLKVSGGGANPERLGSQWGIGLAILGLVTAIISSRVTTLSKRSLTVPSLPITYTHGSWISPPGTRCNHCDAASFTTCLSKSLKISTCTNAALPAYAFATPATMSVIGPQNR